ncbi:hypothetical protein ACH5RR_011418 [Cinchona calisaya]|uniref:Transmembrane protein 131-like N-terminal domain-containing protein n=1 Tax=Cinchona calisaya TaxID=153742 RepID=A0ABD3A7D5_9GENT
MLLCSEIVRVEGIRHLKKSNNHRCRKQCSKGDKESSKNSLDTQGDININGASSSSPDQTNVSKVEYAQDFRPTAPGRSPGVHRNSPSTPVNDKGAKAPLSSSLGPDSGVNMARTTMRHRCSQFRTSVHSCLLTRGPRSKKTIAKYPFKKKKKNSDQLKKENFCREKWFEEMEFETLRMIGAPPQLATPNMFIHRRMWRCGDVFYFMVVLITLVITWEPCSVSGLRYQAEYDAEYDACRSYMHQSNSDYQDIFFGDVDSRLAADNLEPHGSFDNVCPDSNLFCFRSTLHEHVDKPIPAEVSGIRSDVKLHARSNHVRTNISWSSNCGIIKFSSGRTISCSLNFQEGCQELPCNHMDSGEGNDVSSCRRPLLNHKSQYFKSIEDVRMRKSGMFVGSSPHVEISPPLLDWGEKYVYFPSLAFLTAMNTHSDNILTIYEPYSTNSQFYPCNFSEIVLAPGEVASICFVFLPTWLGFSSAQLVLQTSSGGFLIQATGFALKTHYEVEPLTGVDVSSSGKWRKNLSLFNPFNEALYVEEVTAWISVSSGNTSHSTKAVCGINSIEDQHDLSLPSGQEWIDVKSSEVGVPLVSMRPHKNWEVASGTTETIMELDFSFPAKGRIVGAFCMQLLRSSKDDVDTVMVPLEAELGGNSAYDEHGSPVSVSVQALVPCYSSGTVVINLSLKNDAPYMVSIVKIIDVGESTKYFHTKYMEGLILFPGTVTQVAVVLCTSISSQMIDPPSEPAEMNMNCEILVLTNDTRNSEIKIPCGDVVSVCSRHTLDSSIGFLQGSELVKYQGAGKKFSGSSRQPPLLHEALNTAEADEMVLKNWKSHATASGISVLVDQEILFPVVQVGSHSSQFVVVKNPSLQPVVMQLILHSGEIIADCKAADGHLRPSFSRSLIGDKSSSPARYGFSMAEGAFTEAVVQPYAGASLGPIVFQPSDRCGWRSSVLIRNNLSGVEWLSLRGFGGSFSMVLSEESEPVQRLEFKLSLPIPHAFSSLDFLYRMEDNIHTCSHRLSKKMHVKNMGDLPLEVRNIKVSGTECGSGGFVVQTCESFVLEPGKSIKLILTYQADFSAATIQRDLELALATGILVIPMEANLPPYMLSFCKKTIFWMRVKKSLVAILLTASVFFLVLCFFLPTVITFGQDYLFKSGKRSSYSVSQAGKSSHANHSHKSCSKFALSAKMNGLLRSIGEEESLLLEPVGMYHNGQIVTKEQGLTAEPVKSTLEFDKKSSCFLDTQKEMISFSSSITTPVAVESSDIPETLQDGNLSVKTGKDKGRRRRKKKSSGNGVVGLFEVSSSQSGNSTPSSPLSPVSSLTPNRSRPMSPDMNQTVRERNPFATVAAKQCESSTPWEPKTKATVSQSEISSKPIGKKDYACGITTVEKHDVLHKMPSKPVLLPSATFPQAGRPDSLWSRRPSFLASASTIAPHARAPGSKLHKQKAVKPEEKTVAEEKFTYDIWGDHIFGLTLMDRSKEVSGLQPHVAEYKSDSFFVQGPQSLLKIAEHKSVLRNSR